MRSFIARQSVIATATSQPAEVLEESRILQKFNLSRGRVYPGESTCVRDPGHTLDEGLNYLKNIYLSNHTKALAAAELPVGFPEEIEASPGRSSAHPDLSRPRVRATVAVLAGRRRRPDRPNPRRS